MIAEPLNDGDCLGKLTEVAASGQHRRDVREIAARFRTTGELAAWIRGLPQRDDGGEPGDGPQVTCDVPQRARLVADDPNCVERSLLYLAAAEMIDAHPVRQLATIDTTCGRHTFPVENGRPVVLDPRMTRNGLAAGVWHIRNAGGCGCVSPEAMEPRALLTWLAELAEEVAEQYDGAAGLARVRRGRGVFAALAAGELIAARDRADVLYVLRAGAEGARLFGEVGAAGLRVARSALSSLLATPPLRPRNLDRERAAYWTGKAIATVAGVGFIYDPAYDELVKPRLTPKAPPPPAPPQIVPARSPVAHVAADSDTDSPGALPGSLDALVTKGG